MYNIIHYSCESFYDIKDGRTPRITSIAVRDLQSGQTNSFSIHKSAELAGVIAADILHNYDPLEKAMLDEFYAYITSLSKQKLIHWNMRDISYGFFAIEHRYKALGGTPYVIDDSRKLDLARELINIYGPSYVPHSTSGRMHSLMEVNSIVAKDAMTGAEEAKAFDAQEYVRLHQSTLRKADVINNILERQLDGTLKTRATFKEKYGFYPAALWEKAKDHWIIGVIGTLAALAGLVALFR